jgi:hypothetical protein
MSHIVFQEWMFPLPMQQQSVLVLACRGPDGIPKHHPSKGVVQRYRASVLKAARLGRVMLSDENEGGDFLTLEHFTDDHHWSTLLRDFFENVDGIAHHYYMHLMHGAEIIGYKHPQNLFRDRWGQFYSLCCKNLHLPPESEGAMDARLSDWDRQHWAAPAHVFNEPAATARSDGSDKKSVGLWSHASDGEESVGLWPHAK